MMIMAYKAQPLSKREISQITRDIRKSCGYEHKPRFPIVEFLEFVLPTVFPDINLKFANIREMPFTEGETNLIHNTIALREDIYLAACQGEGRARFTIAHEIGHYLLHPPETIAFCRINEGSQLRPFEDPEWQANYFASELLAPAYLADGKTIIQIKEEFQITESAARVVASKCKKQHALSMKGGIPLNV